MNTHARSQFVSENVANHPHILVLPRRDQPEDKQRLLSHRLTLFFIHYPLSFSSSPTPPCPISHISPTFQLYCHHSFPIFLQSTLSPPSQCCIDFHEASPVISPYLLIPKLTLSTLQGCCHLPHRYTISLSISSFSPLRRTVFPPPDVSVIHVFLLCNQSPLTCTTTFFCLQPTFNIYVTALCSPVILSLTFPLDCRRCVCHIVRYCHAWDFPSDTEVFPRLFIKNNMIPPLVCVFVNKTYIYFLTISLNRFWHMFLFM